MKMLYYKVERDEEGKVLRTSLEPAEVTDKSGERLHEMYKLLDCEFVDYREFEVNGEYFDVWFDEEFLLRDKPPVATMFLGDLRPDSFIVLCGNLLFSKSNDEGESVTLTKRDMRKIAGFFDESQLKLMMAFSSGLINSRL